MVRFNLFDFWFRPKPFESERFYERLGALVIKRYVPTGGDLVMRRLRRNHPGRRWVNSSLQSLRQYERRTRLNELIHLIGFVGFTVLIGSKFASGSLPVLGIIFALALNLIFGLCRLSCRDTIGCASTGLSTGALIWQIASNDLNPRRAIVPPRTSSNMIIIG
ncbi:MAG: hypothetical protein QOJ51_345 [Acidobacteriaceae bacterium]|jgi:hypothetical protein|nr:hypothetical protein [Acidobacteriaceae bacterium]